MLPGQIKKIEAFAAQFAASKAALELFQDPMLRAAVGRGEYLRGKNAFKDSTWPKARTVRPPTPPTDYHKVVAFRSIADSGKPSKVEGYDFPLLFDLSSLKIAANQPVPVYRSHAGECVGYVDFLSIQRRGRLEGQGYLFRPGVVSPGAEIQAAAQNGTDWEVSLGCRFHIAEYVFPGQRIDLNGSSFKGPVVVLRRARLAELSIAPPHKAADKGSFLLVQGTWEFAHYLSRPLPTAAELVALRIQRERERILTAERADAAARRLDMLCQFEVAERRQEAAASHLAWIEGQRTRDLNTQKTIADLDYQHRRGLRQRDQ
jgi:hypothetical protein